jgi:nitric oxide dioxygenase
MTPRQIELVRSSFAQVGILTNQPAAIFLDQLFAAEPALRREFLGCHWLEGDRLMRMLSSTVFLLDRPGELQTALQLLGARTLERGSARRRCLAFSAALIGTLEICLQSAFTPALREAWLAFCGFAEGSLVGHVKVVPVAEATRNPRALLETT